MKQNWSYVFLNKCYLSCRYLIVKNPNFWRKYGENALSEMKKYIKTGFHQCIWIAFSDKYVIKKGGGWIFKNENCWPCNIFVRYHLNLPYMVNILILIFHGQSGKKLKILKNKSLSQKSQWLTIIGVKNVLPFHFTNRLRGYSMLVEERFEMCIEVCYNSELWVCCFSASSAAGWDFPTRASQTNKTEREQSKVSQISY